MKHCDDCGTKKTIRGVCPNCQEELYINDEQMGEFPVPVSDEWNEIIERQRKKVKNALLKVCCWSN